MAKQMKESTKEAKSKKQTSPSVGKGKSKGATAAGSKKGKTGDDNAKEHFVRGVLTRGEATKAKKGKLPPGATHEIVKEEEGKLPQIERRRFSLY